MAFSRNDVNLNALAGTIRRLVDFRWEELQLDQALCLSPSLSKVQICCQHRNVAVVTEKLPNDLRKVIEPSWFATATPPRLNALLKPAPWAAESLSDFVQRIPVP